jgi:hypothetical protein
VGGLAHQWDWGVRTPGFLAGGGVLSALPRERASRVARGFLQAPRRGENRAFESAALTSYLRSKLMRLSLVMVVEMRIPPSRQHQDE